MRRDWSELRGVDLASSTVHTDDRGSFTKLLALEDPARARQVCVTHNHERGTVRGLHVQREPHPETKILWCAQGEIWDVLVDLRPQEPTYGDWAAVQLEGHRPRALTVPPGVAHGYQTLTVDAVVVYLIDGVHAPQDATTLRWDDATVAVEWPLAVTRISEADRAGRAWPPS